MHCGRAENEGEAAASKEVHVRVIRLQEGRDGAEETPPKELQGKEGSIQVEVLGLNHGDELVFLRSEEASSEQELLLTLENIEQFSVDYLGEKDDVLLEEGTVPGTSVEVQIPTDASPVDDVTEITVLPRGSSKVEQLQEMSERDSWTTEDDVFSLPTSTAEEAVHRNKEKDVAREEKERLRREKERLRKRKERRNEEYRARERCRNREQMIGRRQDAEYSRAERERERERKRVLRMNNPQLRAAERERDRLYRRLRSLIMHNSKSDASTSAVQHR